jgi:BTB/POZ domain
MGTRRLDLWRSPEVLIFVGPEKKSFNIPKALVCHYSKFFDRAFNSALPFREAIEKICLEEDKVEAFRIVLQWMYTSNVNVPSHYDLADQVDALLEFFKLADKIDLLGPLTPVSEKLKNILKGSRGTLLPVVCSATDCGGGVKTLEDGELTMHRLATMHHRLLVSVTLS